MRQHTARQTTTRAARAVVVPFLALLLAAGCSNDSGSGNAGSANGPNEGSTKVRTPSQPTTDAKLTMELGAATTTALNNAGCQFGTFPGEKPEHVDARQLKWDTFPPTSGTHLNEWAPFGVYDERVADGYAVHNLEHGGVIVWLGTQVPADMAKAIGGLPKDKEKWLVSPRPDLEGLASVAWSKSLTCAPDALTKLGVDGITDALKDWFDVVNSTGSKDEKDVPAFAGSMKEPTPKRDISEDAPF